MMLYFIECRTGCDCCQHKSHFRGPYISYGDAERRRLRLLESGIDGFHAKGKLWVVEKPITHTINFGMIVWVMDGQWFYESDIIKVNDDGTSPHPAEVEKFCAGDEL